MQELTLPATGQIYLCGPLGFMNDIRNGLIRIGHNPHRIHYEVFGDEAGQGFRTIGDHL